MIYDSEDTDQTGHMPSPSLHCAHIVFGLSRTYKYVYHLFTENAIKRILIGAKPLYSNGLDTYYMKPGGHAKAVTDFESLKPEKFKTKTLKGTIVSLN